jgi:hypothetical protein
MKGFILIYFLFGLNYIQAQINYDSCFTSERLRYDYVVSGNDSLMRIQGYRFFREPVWGGSKINLTDKFGFGDMLLKVSDSISGELIFSKAYSTLFKEWQTTNEADKREAAFLESIDMPFPKKPVELKILSRSKDLSYQEIHSCYLNPHANNINLLRQPVNSEIKTIKSVANPSQITDLVFIAEGYTKNQKKKFYSDVKRFSKAIYNWEPYSDLPGSFNIYAVFVPSDQSGADSPSENIWVNTTLGASYNTFESERYLTVSDYHLLRNYLAGLPCDQICVLVNSDRYAGGGIYNFFTVITSDNKNSEFLFHHEFGHAFASLADEYYTSSVSYTEMFDLNVEPYQPNITTLVDFEKKWKYMMDDTTPVPTPDTTLFEGVVGVYEGAAYNAKGIYRPALNCSMKSVTNNAFCQVCREAIKRMIMYSKE